MLKILANLSVACQTRYSLVCQKWSALVGHLTDGELIVYHSKPAKSHKSGVFVRTNAAFSQVLSCSRFKAIKKLILHLNTQLLKVPPIDLSNFSHLEQLEINHPTAGQLMLDTLIEKRVQLSSLKLYNCYRILDLTKVYEVFPNLTHIKTAFIERIDNECIQLPAGTFYPLEYFEQYHYTCSDRSLLDFLLIACPSIEYLTLSLSNVSRIPQLVQSLASLKELNLNVPNEKLKFCFKFKSTIFKAIGKRDVIFRINGLPVKKADTRITKFRVDPDELYLITYEQLSLANQLDDEHCENELQFYFNNFKGRCLVCTVCERVGIN